MEKNKIESKVVASLEEAEKEENKVIYDLDEGVLLLMNFNKKSVTKSKDFKKIGKKYNGSSPEKQKQEILKYIDKELYPIFYNEFISKFYKNNELEKLDREVINTYIFGAFLEGHAKRLEMSIPVLFKNLIKELTDRAVYAKRNS